MSESTINAIITAVGSLLGGIIGAYATIQAAKAKTSENPNKSDSKLPLFGIVIGAVIGAVATLGVLAFLGFIPTTSSGAPKEKLFTQNFDGTDGSFDTNIFECPAISCNAQNVFQRNGTLVFKFNDSEVSSDVWGAYVKSRVTWKAEDLISIEGNIQISSNTIGGAWLGLSESASCSLSVGVEDDTPNLRCNHSLNEIPKYTTADLPVKFDTWYSIRIEYDSLTGEQKYYLDDILIGKYTPEDHLDLVSLALGAWREGNQSVNAYIDNIVVKTKP